MRAICKMSKLPTTWPCAAPACPLFGDCIVEYQRKAAIRESIGKAINDYRYKTGKNPAAILAEPLAFRELVTDEEMAYRDPDLGWFFMNFPIKEIKANDFRSDHKGIYLVPEMKPILTLPEEG